MFVAVEVGDKECYQSQDGGNSNVACNIGASGEYRDKAQYVAEEDEEEQSEEIRKEAMSNEGRIIYESQPEVSWVIRRKR